MCVWLLIALTGQQAPLPPQAPLEARVVALERRLAELELRMNAAPNQVAVRIEGHKPANPVKAAVNVATAPVRALQTICSGGTCRVVDATDAYPIEVYSPPVQPPTYSGGCSNGSCGVSRSWFGRRR